MLVLGMMISNKRSNLKTAVEEVIESQNKKYKARKIIFMSDESFNISIKFEFENVLKNENSLSSYPPSSPSSSSSYGVTSPPSSDSNYSTNLISSNTSIHFSQEDHFATPNSPLLDQQPSHTYRPTSQLPEYYYLPPNNHHNIN